MQAVTESPNEDIELLGVTTNNLKGIDVRLALGKISVVTGVSGSGKSSLVFDTLYGEAYRRYVESLSSFARQYLKALPKPAIEHVRNLPPAIAVQQTRSGATNRSTVGTATELIDLVRIFFTHLSRIHCTSCGRVVEKETPETIACKTVGAWRGKKVLIAAPLTRWGKVAFKDLKSQLEQQGFTRLALAATKAAPEVVKLEQAKVSDLKGASIVVDRVKLDDAVMSRLIEASQLSLKAGRGLTEIIDEEGQRLLFSSGLDCAACNLAYIEPSAALFSFNHPLGACAGCQGFGYASEVDLDKAIPKRTASLAEKGVTAWNFGAFAEYYEWAKTSAKRVGIKFDKAFEDYTRADWQWLLRGEGKQFDGVLGFFEYLESKKYKAHYRIHAARFRKYALCGDCGGARLNAKALACKVGGKDVAQVAQLSIEVLDSWVRDLERDLRAGAVSANGLQDEDGTMGVAEALEEAHARVGYLRKIGVDYLTLDRSARTLSGGELQRINMARCLGSALTDTLFCLDEPSAGLHARDSNNLLEVIHDLRDQGNTVVLVEHERNLILGADHLLEIGPKAGHEGGRIVFQGDPHKGMELTRPVPVPVTRGRNPEAFKFLTLKGASTHNLKAIDVRIPVGAITAVCGVSGSGKTSLVQHTFYPSVARELGQPIDRAMASEPQFASVGPLPLLKVHGEVMLVSQGGLGRSSRSNIATYLGMMDEIRKLLADQPMARKVGLTPGSFSFNTPGGRCETCKGLGTVVEDLSFLGEMEVTCPVCAGRRFGDDVLAVEYRGKNLLAILALTIAEAREFFFERPAIVRICDLMLGLGMGYLTLGQHTSSFSGGEAQRLKLVGLMRDVKDAKPSLLIFDEPTTGLSDRDVANLLAQLAQLAAKGHTLVVVEHHLDVLRAVDWLIEIGPEAGSRGGQLVYEGPPAGLSGVEASVTAPYLFPTRKTRAVQGR